MKSNPSSSAPLTPTQQMILWDETYHSDQHMVATPFKSPGYHTKVASGTSVHQVITACEYALLCLHTREPERIARALEIWKKILPLQDTVPTSAGYGIWPYLLEEPINEMVLPDWNWADFVGARIAEVLIKFPEDLPPTLAEDLRKGLGNAALSIFRRNITPGYTNIAIMGGAVCVAAGEVLEDTRLLAYGRQRLQDCVVHAEYHGTFTEYNSPAYTPLALHEAERVLYLTKDPDSRAAAEKLRWTAWKVIADHFHPGTAQWAGPHARTYGDLLDDRSVAELSSHIGVAIPTTDTLTERLWCGPIDLTLPGMPCPDDLVARFQHLPQPEFTNTQMFIRREKEGISRIGTTWMNEDACLGSVSHDILFYQRRPLIGYWKTPGKRPAVIRMRFLCNGVDFCSANIRTQQVGAQTLSCIHFINGLGYNALHMDVPKEGKFEVDDFRVRVHLIAEEAECHGFELQAADWKVAVHPGESYFGDDPVRWESGSGPGEAWVDGICHTGSRKTFQFDTFGDVLIGLGLELLPVSAAPSAEPLQVLPPDQFSWQGMKVKTSLRPTPYQWI